MHYNVALSLKATDIGAALVLPAQISLKSSISQKQNLPLHLLFELTKRQHLRNVKCRRIFVSAEILVILRSSKTPSFRPFHPKLQSFLNAASQIAQMPALIENIGFLLDTFLSPSLCLCLIYFDHDRLSSVNMRHTLALAICALEGRFALKLQSVSLCFLMVYVKEYKNHVKLF